MKFTNLVHANYQLTLFDQAEKQTKLMFAMDYLRKRYGIDSISRANGVFHARDKKTGNPSLHGTKGKV